jgi:hypothetical protein
MLLTHIGKKAKKFEWVLEDDSLLLTNQKGGQDWKKKNSLWNG